jgi:hypothetical protein
MMVILSSLQMVRAMDVPIEGLYPTNLENIYPVRSDRSEYALGDGLALRGVQSFPACERASPVRRGDENLYRVQ